MPLNDRLYKALSVACRKGPPLGLAGGKVIVTNPGQNLQCFYRQDPLGKTGKMIQEITSHGEVYRVCCPYCGDQRHRLWVNHMWGVYDQTTQAHNYHLIKCFNEDCTKNPDFRDMFRNSIDLLTNSIQLNAPQVVITQQQEEIKQIEPPGQLVPLSALPKEHPGIKFLISRGHNPRRLGREYEVAWCDYSKYPQACHRLIVPVKFQDKLVGWQARYVDTTGSGDCSELYMCQNNLCMHVWKHTEEAKPVACPICKQSEVPPQPVRKWYTSPGAKIGSVMLNYDRAQAYNYAIIVEGPMDVFKIGNVTKSDLVGPAMAVFNSQLTTHQLNLLAKWRETGPIFLLFDDDMWDKTCKQAIKLSPHFKHGVIPVALPNGTDPGDLPHEVIWDCIKQSAEIFGVKWTY